MKILSQCKKKSYSGVSFDSGLNILVCYSFSVLGLNSFFVNAKYATPRILKLKLAFHQFCIFSDNAECYYILELEHIAKNLH